MFYLHNSLLEKRFQLRRHLAIVDICVEGSLVDSCGERSRLLTVDGTTTGGACCDES